MHQILRIAVEKILMANIRHPSHLIFYHSFGVKIAPQVFIIFQLCYVTLAVSKGEKVKAKQL